MITEWFLTWVSGVLQWLTDLLPDWDMPAELTDPGGLMAQLVSNAQGLGVWIDFAGVATIAMIPLGVWVIGLLWKALRTAFSHFPGIGGAG